MYIVKSIIELKPMNWVPLVIFFQLFIIVNSNGQESFLRKNGIEIGIFKVGPKNYITDVPGVSVGHVTLLEGQKIRTGVTAILAHEGNIFQEKVPAAIYTGNGFGKLAGSTQVHELGNIETPIILTNTLSVAAGIEGVIKYTLAQNGNEKVRSVNAVVGETNDGQLNDIRGMHVTSDHVKNAIASASINETREGNIGAGTGTVCFGFKGGIGSSSRILPSSHGGYTVGVLVQTNFGGVLEIAGVPVGKELGKYPFKDALNNPDGSCMIVVMTDAPLDSRSLERLARRAMLGLAKTGGMSSNGSGDYVIAVSTARQVRYDYTSASDLSEYSVLRHESLSPLFQAVIESTEEAILNSLFSAKSMSGKNNHFVPSIKEYKILEILNEYNRIQR